MIHESCEPRLKEIFDILVGSMVNGDKTYKLLSALVINFMI